MEFKFEEVNRIMQITAASVKELRDRTGAGMMECKKALQEAGGDIETAIENMRKSGLAKAAKKAGRIAAEGVIIIEKAEDAERVAIVEVNCETDFVTKGDDFQQFATAVADCVLRNDPEDLEALKATPLEAGGTETVEECRQNLVAKIGENINVRRFSVIGTETGRLGVYLHGGRIGVVVDLANGDESLARDVAMHVAASKPVCVSEQDVPVEIIDKEKEIFAAQAADSGKPPEIVEKMISGRIQKFINEITLLGQPFIKDPDTKVGKLLDEANASVTGFVRFEVGEGIEKKEENFAEEVMAQAKG